MELGHRMKFMWKICGKKTPQNKTQKKLYFLTLLCAFSHRTYLSSLHSSRDEKNQPYGWYDAAAGVYFIQQKAAFSSSFLFHSPSAGRR